MLSGALYQAMKQTTTGQTLTYGQWINDVTQITHHASAASPGALQTPLFVGQRDQLVFQVADPYLPLFAFAERRRWDEYTVEQLERQYQRFVRLVAAPFPQVAAAFGQAFLARGAYPQAQMALEQALIQAQDLADEQATAVAAWRALQTQVTTVVAFSRRVLLFLLDGKERDLATPHASKEATAVANQLELLAYRLKQLYGETGYTLEIHKADQLEEAALLTTIREACAAVGAPPTLICIIGDGTSFYKSWHTAQLRQELADLIDNRSILLWWQKSARITAPR